MPADRIIMYTDGVTDAVNSDGERYSINRFLSSVERHCLREAEDLAAALFDDVHSWTAKTQLADDVAIYVLHVHDRMQPEEDVEVDVKEDVAETETSLFD